jgi:DNA-binding GntR family transcriptional regulator
MSGLEGLAARVSAPLVAERQVERMAVLLAELRKLGAKQDVEAYLDRRWDLHATCYRASGRQRLVGEVERLYWRSERYNRLVLSAPERFRDSLAWYAAFVEACEARDGAAAEAAVQASIRWALANALPSLPSEAED